MNVSNEALDALVAAALALGHNPDAAHNYVCDTLGVPPDERELWRDPVQLRLDKHTQPQPEVQGSIEFVSWQHLHEVAPAEPRWVIQGLFARDAVTLATGKPKVGKSTLVSAACIAVDAGAERFLGRGVTGGPVIYVSEEAGVTLKPKLSPSTSSRVLTRDMCWPRPSWTTLVDAAIGEARDIDAALLVIDSYVYWAQLTEGQENDSSVNQQMLAQLVAAANAGLAVVLVHHNRKAGGEQGDAVRGSGGIFAAVDALIEVERIEKAPPQQRQLVATGRWPGMAPVTVLDYDEATGSWGVVGEVEDRRAAGRLRLQEELLKLIPMSGVGPTVIELEEALGMNKRDFHEDLQTMARQGRIRVVGRGVKGDPHRYTQMLCTTE